MINRGRGVSDIGGIKMQHLFFYQEKGRFTGEGLEKVKDKNNHRNILIHANK